MNTVYAYLADRWEAVDQVRIPALLAAGWKSEEVVKMSARDAFDEWLSAPDVQTQGYQRAVARALGGAG